MINTGGFGPTAAQFPGGWAGARPADAGGGGYWGSTSADAVDVLSVLLSEGLGHHGDGA